MAKERNIHKGADLGDLKRFAMSKKDANTIAEVGALGGELGHTEAAEHAGKLLNDTSELDNPEAFVSIQNDTPLVDRPIAELNEMFGNTDDGIRITQSDIDKMGHARLNAENAKSPLASPEPGEGAPVIYRKGLKSRRPPGPQWTSGNNA